MGLLEAPYQKLEKRFAKFVHSKHAVSCNTGTAALHLGLLALGVGKGDEVIVPDFTMAACAFAVSYCGATPVFVDAEEKTYGINPLLIEEAITKKTKAIMVVHVYGHLARIDEVIEIGKKHGIPVIEDASEAHGAVKFSHADVTCYSFYKNKIIHAEEGGIVTTDRKELADRMRFLKNMAFTPEHDYFHPEIGYNYRMPDSQASLVLQSMNNYHSNRKKRRVIESYYNKLLPVPANRRDAVWFYEVFVRSTKEPLEEFGARHAFKPLSSFPMYGGGKGHPVARKLSQMILLPCHPSLGRGEVRYICSKLLF